MSKKSHHFLTLWPWPLTYDLEKLIRSGHYHYQCVYQIWEQSIPWFLSYRVNTIAGGRRLRRKTITSPDPSDTMSFSRNVRKLKSIQNTNHEILWHGNSFHITRPLGGEYDDVIKWKHFPPSWPFVRGIHRFPANSPHKGQWQWALMFSFICVWINGWVNNCKAGDLRRYHTHYDVTVMNKWSFPHTGPLWGESTSHMQIPITMGL